MAPRPSGNSPQAEGLRELNELLTKLDSKVVDLLRLIPHATRLDEALEECSALLETTVGSNDRLTVQLAGKLRLIRELRQIINDKLRAGDDLTREQVLLTDEVRRLQAFIRLLQHAQPTNQGGGNLRNGERNKMNHPCRGLLFFWLLVGAVLFGIVGGIGSDRLGLDGLWWIVTIIGVIGLIAAHIGRFTEWGQSPIRPQEMRWPFVPLPTPANIQVLHDAAELIKTRPGDGLSVKEAELVAKEVELAEARTELDEMIHQEVIDRAEEFRNLRDVMCDSYDALEDAKADPASTPAVIQTAQEAYDNAVRLLGEHADTVTSTAQATRAQQDRITAIVNEIQAVPAGLKAVVAMLQTQYGAAKAAEQAAIDAFERDKEEHNNKRYSIPVWYLVAAFSVFLLMVSVWDYKDLNKTFGDAHVANGQDLGFWGTSGGVPSAVPLVRNTCPELVELGAFGPVIVRKMDGKIVIYTAAKVAPGVDWQRQVETFSIPDPNKGK